MGHRSRAREPSDYSRFCPSTPTAPTLPEAQRTTPIRTERYGSTPEVPHAYLDPPQGTPSIGPRPIAPPGGPIHCEPNAWLCSEASPSRSPSPLPSPRPSSRPVRPSSCSPVTRSPALPAGTASRSAGWSSSMTSTDPNRIFAGQRLRVAAGGSRTSARAQTPTRRTVHVVSSGSTLWGIAAHYGVSVGSIAAANHLANPSLIFAGQRLAIPGAPAHRRSRPHADAGGGASAPRRAASVVHVVSPRIDAVGHCRALQRERWIHRRGQPSRRSEPNLRRPAPPHSRWKRAHRRRGSKGEDVIADGPHRRRAGLRFAASSCARLDRYGVPRAFALGGGLAGVGLAAGRREPRRRGRRHAADARDRRVGRRDDASPARGHPRGAEQHRGRRAAARATISTGTAGIVTSFSPPTTRVSVPSTTSASIPSAARTSPRSGASSSSSAADL